MPKKKKIPCKLTPANRYDISLIGEAISEGGNGVFIESYAEANKGILEVGIPVNGEIRFYKIKIKPYKKPKSEFFLGGLL